MIEQVKMRDGESIAVCKIGMGKRKVFLIHGIGGSHHAWIPFAAPFLLDFTFIIPNLRGFGLSSEVPYNNEDVIENYADDIEDMVNYFLVKNEKFILTSLSMGAFSSMCFLSREHNRKRVAKYLNIDQAPMAMNSDDWVHGLISAEQDVLIDATQFLMDYADKDNFLDLDYAQIPKDFKKKFIDTMVFFFSSAFHRKPEKLAINLILKLESKHIQKLFSIHKFKSYYSCMYAYKTYAHDFRSELPNFNFPVTVFAGKHSEMYPVLGQKFIADTVPILGDYVEFDESHALMYTAPVKFTREFRKFLYS